MEGSSGEHLKEKDQNVQGPKAGRRLGFSWSEGHNLQKHGAPGEVQGDVSGGR